MSNHLGPNLTHNLSIGLTTFDAICARSTSLFRPTRCDHCLDFFPFFYLTFGSTWPHGVLHDHTVCCMTTRCTAWSQIHLAWLGGRAPAGGGAWRWRRQVIYHCLWLPCPVISGIKWHPFPPPPLTPCVVDTWHSDQVLDSVSHITSTLL